MQEARRRGVRGGGFPCRRCGQGRALLGLHPALLEAVCWSAAGLAADEEPGTVLRPSAWSGISLHATGAAVLRARLTRAGDIVSMVAADGMGTPVITVSSWFPAVDGDRSAGRAAAGRAAGRPIRRRLGCRIPGARWRQAGGSQVAGGRGWSAMTGSACGRAGGGWRAVLVAGYADVAGLAAAVAAGEPAPDVVLVCAGSRDAGSGGGAGGEAGLAGAGGEPGAGFGAGVPGGGRAGGCAAGDP